MIRKATTGLHTGANMNECPPVGSQVQVYWNSHKRLWSIRFNRKVVFHSENVVLSDVRFVVSERGRLRVLRERKKNVHAYAEGILPSHTLACSRRVTYNPYRDETFICDGRPIADAAFAHFMHDGRVFA